MSDRILISVRKNLIYALMFISVLASMIYDYYNKEEDKEQSNDKKRIIPKSTLIHLVLLGVAAALIFYNLLASSDDDNYFNDDDDIQTLGIQLLNQSDVQLNHYNPKCKLPKLDFIGHDTQLRCKQSVYLI